MATLIPAAGSGGGGGGKGADREQRCEEGDEEAAPRHPARREVVTGGRPQGDVGIDRHDAPSYPNATLGRGDEGMRRRTMRWGTPLGGRARGRPAPPPPCRSLPCLMCGRSGNPPVGPAGPCRMVRCGRAPPSSRRCVRGRCHASLARSRPDHRAVPPMTSVASEMSSGPVMLRDHPVRRGPGSWKRCVDRSPATSCRPPVPRGHQHPVRRAAADPLDPGQRDLRRLLPELPAHGELLGIGLGVL